MSSSPLPETPTLTPTQTEVLDLVASGHRNKDIAAKTGMSEETVKMHVGEIIQILGIGKEEERTVSSREEAPVEEINLTAEEEGLLDLIGKGLRNKDIAPLEGISEKAVKRRVSALLRKMGIEPRIQTAEKTSKLNQKIVEPV